MSNRMLLTAKLDQRLVMSQQLRQAIALLQYNTIDLKQLVQQYLDTNPLIELDEFKVPEQGQSEKNEDEEGIETYSANYNKSYQSVHNDNYIENYSVPKTLRIHLLEQTWLCRFNQIEQSIAEAIIDAIDENGHLTMSLADIQQALNAKQPPSIDLMQWVLSKIKQFDPIGVGSRDIKECLLIQLDNIKPESRDRAWVIAKKMIEDYEVMILKNSKNMIKQLKINSSEYHDAIKLLRVLQPHPGQYFINDTQTNLEPELYLRKIKGKWHVFLSESILTNVKINKEYQNLIAKNKKQITFDALGKELQEAQWLLKGLQRRNETLLKVADYIVELQKDFLDFGFSHMRPLNIKDVSQALGLHESTVSRVTNGKYMITPFGVLELKYFFPSHVATQDGNVCSAISVQEEIKKLINQEMKNHILSDEEIAVLLKGKGINIARRTVAKYREALKIPPSYQRAHTKGLLAIE